MSTRTSAGPAPARTPGKTRPGAASGTSPAAPATPLTLATPATPAAAVATAARSPASSARLRRSRSRPASAPPARPAADPFRALGLYGMGTLAPVLLAALATEAPLLLVGPHGTAKSLLLTRVAEALGLESRHYNASLLNFDDLIGFPFPGSDGRLEYVRTPAAIWGAGAVIFDEVSRCRPEIQNKLFPIIHERRVQGIALDGLRYRWAAMNPPSMPDDDNGYDGSEPLDAALADRFAFIVEMPGWDRLSSEEQLAVIRAEDSATPGAAADALARALARTRTTLGLVDEERIVAIAGYVQSLVGLLARAGLALSPRRAGMLHRAVLAVGAAALALDPAADAAEAALLAVRHALPQRAQGIPVADLKVLTAHRDAWRLAEVPASDPLKAILCAPDPVERLGLAIAAASLPRAEFSRVVADTIAAIAPGARDAAIVHLFETGATGRLNAAVANQLAERYRDVITPIRFSETLHATDSRFRTWQALEHRLAQLDPGEPEAHKHANALAASFARKELATPGDVEAAFEAYAATLARLAQP